MILNGQPGYGAQFFITEVWELPFYVGQSNVQFNRAAFFFVKCLGKR